MLFVVQIVINTLGLGFILYLCFLIYKKLR